MDLGEAILHAITNKDVCAIVPIRDMRDYDTSYIFIVIYRNGARAEIFANQHGWHVINCK